MNLGFSYLTIRSSSFASELWAGQFVKSNPAPTSCPPSVYKLSH